VAYRADACAAGEGTEGDLEDGGVVFAHVALIDEARDGAVPVHVWVSVAWRVDEVGLERCGSDVDYCAEAQRLSWEDVAVHGDRVAMREVQTRAVQEAMGALVAILCMQLVASRAVRCGARCVWSTVVPGACGAIRWGPCWACGRLRLWRKQEDGRLNLGGPIALRRGYGQFFPINGGVAASCWLACTCSV
jgi:hypothetical protein